MVDRGDPEGPRSTGDVSMILFLLILAAVLAVVVFISAIGGGDSLVEVTAARTLGLIAMVALVAAAAIHVTEILA